MKRKVFNRWLSMLLAISIAIPNSITPVYATESQNLGNPAIVEGMNNDSDMQNKDNKNSDSNFNKSTNTDNENELLNNEQDESVQKETKQSEEEDNNQNKDQNKEQIDEKLDDKGEEKNLENSEVVVVSVDGSELKVEIEEIEDSFKEDMISKIDFSQVSGDLVWSKNIEVETETDVNVEIEIDDLSEDKIYKVVHFVNGETPEYLDTKVENGKIVFKVNSFSPFMIYESDDILHFEYGNMESLFAWLEKYLPNGYEDLLSYNDSWWDSMYDYEKEYAETLKSFIVELDENKYADQDLDEIIETIESGIDTKKFFDGTVFENLTLSDLKELKDCGYSLDELYEFMLAMCNSENKSNLYDQYLNKNNLSSEECSKIKKLFEIANIIKPKPINKMFRLVNGDLYATLSVSSTGFKGTNHGTIYALTLGGEPGMCMAMGKSARNGFVYAANNGTYTRKSDGIGHLISYASLGGENYAAAQIAAWVYQNKGESASEDVVRMTAAGMVNTSNMSTAEKVNLITKVWNFYQGACSHNIGYYVFYSENSNAQPIAILDMPSTSVYSSTNPPSEPDPGEPEEPVYPEPEYEDYEDSATTTYRVKVNKSAVITLEKLKGATFSVTEIESGTTKTATSDANGDLSATFTHSDSWSVTYCSNIDEIEFPENEVSYEDAVAEVEAAKEEFESIEYTYKIDETKVPHGFEKNTPISTKFPVTTGDVSDGETASRNVTNKPWQAIVEIDKVDSETSNRIAYDTVFDIYEYDATRNSYAKSTNYTIVRLEENITRKTSEGNAELEKGMYTVKSNYTDGEMGYLYYTQKNEGKFYIQETIAPYNGDVNGYYGDFKTLKDNIGSDKNRHYVELTKDYQHFYLNNNENLGTENADFINDRTLGQITVYKIDTEAERYVKGSRRLKTVWMTSPARGDTTLSTYPELEDLLAGPDHGDANLDGAIYDLYAAEDIYHPDGVYGIADYETTVFDGSNFVNKTVKLEKDALVASAVIKDGKLTYDNLYLGKYYIKERIKETVEIESLNMNGGKESETRKLSYAEGYMVDETVYEVTLSYHNETIRVEKNFDTVSNDQVVKSGFQLAKLGSQTGQSEQDVLEGAGFTVYLISELSKADKFEKDSNGKYTLESILDAYINKEYNNETKKYDFSEEEDAIAKMYENVPGEVSSYNSTLASGQNGTGAGWVATGLENEYQLSELFTNELGIIKSPLLPYGQYLVVETTEVNNYFVVDPFIVDVNEKSPTINRQNMRYQLDEEFEAFLQITKIDEDTGKVVLLKNTSWKIWDLEKEEYVTMTNGYGTGSLEKTDIFYTNERGYLILPEVLTVGKYRLEEIDGPNGFYNEYATTKGTFEEAGAVYFEVTTNRIYQAVGDTMHNDRDIIAIYEDYSNRETRGALTIKKIGEVLTDKTETMYEGGPIGPELDTELEFTKDEIPSDGHIPEIDPDINFVYETRPLANAVFEIYAAEDIYTQDRQVDENKNRTTWFKNGELVATVKTAEEGQSDSYRVTYPAYPEGHPIVVESHNGTLGETQILLPLGTYKIVEKQAPYGFIHSNQEFYVTFTWDNQYEEIVFNTNKETKNDEHNVVFENERVKPVPEETEDNAENPKIGIGVIKKDADTEEVVAGTMFKLYTKHDIYDVDGTLLVEAGTYLDTAVTDENGLAYFDVDAPYMSEYYGKNYEGTNIPYEKQNSGEYIIIEEMVTDGYLLDTTPMEVKFEYKDQFTPYIIIQAMQKNLKTTVEISKQDIVNSAEIPGAILQIIHKDTNEIIEEWVSTAKPHVIRGLYLSDDVRQFENVYILREKIPADGFVTASDVEFKLYQSKDEDGKWINKNEVYVKVVTETKHQAGTVISQTVFSDTADAMSEKVDGKVIATWKCVNGTLTIAFTEEATKEAIEKSFREEDFADLTFDKVFFENGTIVDFYADKVVTEKPADSDVVETVTWTNVTDAANDEAYYEFTVEKLAEYAKEYTSGDIDCIGKAFEEIEDALQEYFEDAELLLFNQSWATYLEENKDTIQDEYVEWLKTYEGESQVLVVMYDDITKVKISKYDITTKEEIVGATIQIINNDGDVVEEWISTDKPHYIERLPIGNYELVEKLAPTENGYVHTETVEFTVDDTGVIQYVHMPDDYTKLQITKTDIVTGKPVIGAELQLVYHKEAGTTNDTEDIEIAKWITTEDPFYIERIPVGKYTLTETLAPFDQGYVTAESIDFEVKETYEIQIQDMDDDFTKVDITKMEPVLKEPLPGAKLQLTDKDGNVVKEWISTKEAYRLERLPIGTYTLTELEAPEGYKIAEPITIEVTDTAEVQVFVMNDEMIPDYISLQITKKVDKATTKPGDTLTYTIDTIYNKSACEINDFTLIDTMPEKVHLTNVTLPTFNFGLEYNVYYKTNLTEKAFKEQKEAIVNPVAEWTLWKEKLSTVTTYALDVKELKLANGEYITEFKIEFGTVPSRFKNTSDMIYTGIVDASLKRGEKLVNEVELTGMKNTLKYTVDANVESKYPVIPKPSKPDKPDDKPDKKPETPSTPVSTPTEDKVGNDNPTGDNAPITMLVIVGITSVAAIAFVLWDKKRKSMSE